MNSRPTIFILLICSILALGLITVKAFAQGHSVPEMTVEITSAAGEVLALIQPSTVWEKVRAGQLLREKDVIHTQDGAMAALTFPDGSTIMLKEKTKLSIEELTLQQNAQKAGLMLDIGQIKVLVSAMNKDSKFEVRTPTAVAAVRGTVFYMDVFKEAVAGLDAGELEQIVTELFVETGDVEFLNLISKILEQVSEGMGSEAYEDGRISPSHTLNPQEQKVWEAGWGKLHDKLKEKKKLKEKRGKAKEKKGNSPPGGPGDGPGDNNWGDRNDNTGDNNNGNGPFYARGLSDERVFNNVPSLPDGQVYADDFSKYSSNRYKINQAQNWFSSDTMIGVQQGWTTYGTSIDGLAHNSINFAPSGIGSDPFDLDTNYATYHVSNCSNFASLALAVDYSINPNSEMKVYISGNNTDWADVSGALDILTSPRENAWDNGFANLSSYVSSLGLVNDLFIQFRSSRSSGTAWGAKVANVEVTCNDAERAMLRNEVRDILDMNTLAQLDDYRTRNEDAQDGFVMRDVHGNRVRVAQYIFKPDNNDPNDTTVKLVNLNYRRGGGNLAGMTSAIYEIKFNKKPPDNLRSLPWKDYFNVRSMADMEGQLVERPLSLNGEVSAIVHSGTPAYWPVEFAVKVTNPYSDYYRVAEFYQDMTEAEGTGPDRSFYRTFKDLSGNTQAAYIQLEQEDLFRYTVASAGNIIFDKTRAEIMSQGLAIQNETGSVHIQNPNTMNTVHLYDTFWTNSDRMDKIKLGWKFYLIRPDGVRMMYDTVYSDPSRTTTANEIFQVHSVRDVLDSRRLGNVEVIFNCFDGNGNSYLNAPIDVVIPQGSESTTYPGILRHYDADGGGGGELDG